MKTFSYTFFLTFKIPPYIKIFNLCGLYFYYGMKQRSKYALPPEYALAMASSLGTIYLMVTTPPLTCKAISVPCQVSIYVQVNINLFCSLCSFGLFLYPCLHTTLFKQLQPYNQPSRANLHSLVSFFKNFLLALSLSLFFPPHVLQGRIVKFLEKSCWDSDWNYNDSQIYYKFMGRATRFTQLYLSILQCLITYPVHLLSNVL